MEDEIGEKVKEVLFELGYTKKNGLKDGNLDKFWKMRGQNNRVEQIIRLALTWAYEKGAKNEDV